MTLADSIDALLPQTQCKKCGFDGCRPYAEAIATGSAEINQCPPGGTAGIVRLAQLLARPAIPLNPNHGHNQARSAALIEEPACIGCTLCIQACPTDAIIGAAKRMHSVVTVWCNGCELCVPACPVDCIVMLPLDELARSGDAGASRLLQDSAENLAPVWRHRYLERNARRSLERQRRNARLAAKAAEKLAALANAPASDDLTRKRATIEAALARARARRNTRPA